MRELVLGGSGMIGTELCAALRRAGHEVASLDLKTGCDLRNVGLRPFEECDRVWFLAWDTGGAKYIEDPRAQHRQYINNTELSASVFDKLERTGRPFLFISSQLAGQLNAYGLTKLTSQKWAESLGGKVARLWNVFGWEHPDVRSHVITDLVLAGLQEGRVRCRTTGEERRRFLYKTDCVAALVGLFDGSQDYAEIAGAEWVSIRDAAETVASLLGVDAEFGSASGSEAIVEPEHVLDGWRPVVPLRDGIATVIADAKTYLERREGAATRAT